jgi:hypothetical protein
MGKTSKNKKSKKVKPKKKTEDGKKAKLLKEIEGAFFAFRFYPVAVKKIDKQEATDNIKRLYHEGDDTVRQLILYQFHEHLAKIEEIKSMHTTDLFRRKNPNSDAAQQRIQVYRAIFHYHHSLEGLMELIDILGQLEGADAAKLLTYHFSFLSVIENEGSHMLRSVILDALSKSTATYAAYALLRYVRHVDNERLLHRILSALSKWDQKLDALKIPEKERQQLHQEISQVLTVEFGDSHYG